MKRKCESHGDVKAKNPHKLCTETVGSGEKVANRQVGRHGLEVNIKHNTHTHIYRETTTELIQL